MVRFFSSFIFFFVPLFALTAGIVMLVMSSIFGPINVSALDRTALVNVMRLRNFQTLPPETALALTDRCEKEFGRLSVQKPVFQFSNAEKKIYNYFRNQKTPQKSFLEDNLTLMARIRYFQWMNDYEIGTPQARTALMKNVVSDMKYWEELYREFLRASELPIPTLAELIQEFEKMIDSFKVGASPEEIARIDFFKQEMNRAIVANEVHRTVQKAADSFRNTVKETLGTLLLEKKQ